MEGVTKYPRYVRLRQQLLDVVKQPTKLSELLIAVEENGDHMRSYLLLDSEVPKLLSGSIIYSVASDGTLTYHSDKLDTSG